MRLDRLHPLVQQAALVCLNVAARATARAADSVLRDAANGLGGAKKRVDTTRANLRRKVSESREVLEPEDEEEWDR